MQNLVVIVTFSGKSAELLETFVWVHSAGGGLEPPSWGSTPVALAVAAGSERQKPMLKHR